ncbi:unnamed protein product, partial [Effrenium voratum]
GEEIAGKRALLKRSVYGALDAASIWQQTYADVLKKNNIKQCVAWPALFYQEDSDLRLMVHGVLSEKFEYRVDGQIGPEATDGTAMCVLNSVLEFNKDTGVLTYEADPRHAEHIIRALNLEESKWVSTPAEKQKLTDVLAAEGLPELDETATAQYRSLTMRAAYLSMDRADLSEAVKSLARHMKSPTSYSWGRLRRLGRYLVGVPRVQQLFKPQRMFTSIRVYCDSDHAGDLKSRKSTTGLICMLGTHCVKHSSNLQGTVSLSSGGSEFYALVKAGAMGLGLQGMRHAG